MDDGRGSQELSQKDSKEDMYSRGKGGGDRAVGKKSVDEVRARLQGGENLSKVKGGTMSCDVKSRSVAIENMNCLGYKLLMSPELELCDRGMVGVTHGSLMSAVIWGMK